MSQRRSWISMGVVVMLISLLIGNVGYEALAAEPIKIGAVFEQTGPGAAVGLSEFYGARLAAKVVNQGGGINGRPIELIERDNQSTVDMSVSIVRKLCADPKLAAIVGPAWSSNAIGMRAETNANHVPQLSVVGSPKFTEEYYDYAYRNWINDKEQIPNLLRILRDTFKSKKVAMGYPLGAWGEGAAQVLAARSSDYGITLVAQEGWRTEDLDVTIPLRKLMAANPDALVIWGTGFNAGTALLDARKVGIKIPIIGPFGVIDNVAKQRAGDAAIGFFYTTYFSDYAPATSEQKIFAEMYKKEVTAPEAEPVMAAGAWDAVQIAAKALRKVVKGDEPVNREALKAALDQTNYVGVYGNYKWAPTHHDAPYELTLFRIEKVGGKLVGAPYSRK